MKITQREVDNAVILNLNGKLTGGPDAETFREVFKSIIDQGKKNIIVNLEKVSWINSTGLGILISGYTSVRREPSRKKVEEWMALYPTLF